MQVRCFAWLQNQGLRLGFLSLLSQRQKKDLTIVGTDSFFSPVELSFLQRRGRCELHHPGLHQIHAAPLQRTTYKRHSNLGLQVQRDSKLVDREWRFFYMPRRLFHGFQLMGM
jgi:hypothetical protein